MKIKLADFSRLILNRTLQKALVKRKIKVYSGGDGKKRLNLNSLLSYVYISSHKKKTTKKQTLVYTT